MKKQGIILLLVLAITGAGILLFCSNVIAGVHVEIASARSFSIEDYCLETGSGRMPEEIETYISSQEGKQLFVTLLLANIDNQSGYTYEWSDIKIDGHPSYVYFPYTVSLKNKISRGASVHGIMIISDVAFSPAGGSGSGSAKLEMFFHRPLFCFGKSISLSIE